MKIKFRPYLKTIVDTNYHRHLFNTISNHPDVEVTHDEKEESDILFITSGIKNIFNSKISVFIDRSDPHTRPNSFNSDLLVDENLSKIATEQVKRPSLFFTKTPDWHIEADEIDKYNIWSPPFNTPQLITKAKLVRCPIGLPENIFYNSTYKRNIDVFFAGAFYDWYPLRKIIHKELSKMPSLNYYNKFTSGAAIVAETKSPEQYDTQLKEYANKLRNSKVCLFDGGVFNYPVKKYVECIATGCLVMAPVPKEAEYLGYVDGETMVSIDHLNFKEKLEHYLKNETERKRITDNAYQLFLERYALEKSTDIYLNKLKKLL